MNPSVWSNMSFQEIFKGCKQDTSSIIVCVCNVVQDSKKCLIFSSIDLCVINVNHLTLRPLSQTVLLSEIQHDSFVFLLPGSSRFGVEVVQSPQKFAIYYINWNRYRCSSLAFVGKSYASEKTRIEVMRWKACRWRISCKKALTTKVTRCQWRWQFNPPNLLP